MIKDTKLFTQYMNDKLQNENAKFGIGGYAEHRSVYSNSKIFDPGKPGDEPRRFHLGTDIWGRPHTPVMAPLEGIVHSFANNDQFGDYGATIILAHQPGGFTFYTLYGHLSLSSIKNISEGERIAEGDIFAEFGIPSENGHWPPHLHFQIILDIGEWKGDYPGVCRFSEKEKYLANSPDPNLILQLNQYINEG
jgi:murein DD-endopeptidase MepM/ murein hydrolase activator NlpD